MSTNPFLQLKLGAPAAAPTPAATAPAQQQNPLLALRLTQEQRDAIGQERLARARAENPGRPEMSATPGGYDMSLAGVGRFLSDTGKTVRGGIASGIASIPEVAANVWNTGVSVTPANVLAKAAGIDSVSGLYDQAMITDPSIPVPRVATIYDNVPAGSIMSDATLRSAADEIRERGDASMSAGAQVQDQQFEQAEGFAETVKFLSKNPGFVARLLAGEVSEELPAMLAPGGVAGKVAAQAAQAGTFNAREVRDAIASAPPEKVAELAQVWGLAEGDTEAMRQELLRVAPTDSFLKSTAVNSVLQGFVPGARKVEELFSGAPIRAGASRLGNALRGGAGEAAAGSAGEAADAMIVNDALGRPLGEGVGKAAATGLVLDGGTGALAGAAQTTRSRREGELDLEDDPNAEPITREQVLETAIETLISFRQMRADGPLSPEVRDNEKFIRQNLDRPEVLARSLGKRLLREGEDRSLESVGPFSRAVQEAAGQIAKPAAERLNPSVRPAVPGPLPAGQQANPPAPSPQPKPARAAPSAQAALQPPQAQRPEAAADPMAPRTPDLAARLPGIQGRSRAELIQAWQAAATPDEQAEAAADIAAFDASARGEIAAPQSGAAPSNSVAAALLTQPARDPIVGQAPAATGGMAETPPIAGATAINPQPEEVRNEEDQQPAQEVDAQPAPGQVPQQGAREEEVAPAPASAPPTGIVAGALAAQSQPADPDIVEGQLPAESTFAAARERDIPSEAPPPESFIPQVLSEIGWLQEGGSMIRDPETAIGASSQADIDPQRGDVVGRTTWIGKPAADGRESQFWRMRPNRNLSEEDAAGAVAKWRQGRKLGPRQQEFIDYMLKAARDYAEQWNTERTETMRAIVELEAEGIVEERDQLRAAVRPDIPPEDEREALQLDDLLRRAAAAGATREQLLAMLTNQPERQQAKTLWHFIKTQERDRGTDEGRPDQAAGLQPEAGSRGQAEPDRAGEAAPRAEEAEPAAAPAAESRAEGLTLSAPAAPPVSQRARAPSQQGGLFAPPTRGEVLEGERRRRDAERNGETATGRTDMMAGDGELFAGPQPEQVDVEQAIAAEQGAEGAAAVASASRRAFASPDEVRRSELEQTLISRGVAPEIARDLARDPAMPGVQMDDVTGAVDARAGGVKVATLKRAQQHSEDTGEPAVFVSADLTNLGGINKARGNIASEANKDFRALTDAVVSALRETGGDVVPMRTGGDELGFVVVNATEAQVQAALEVAERQAQAYARQAGLAEIPHEKQGRAPGVGWHFGTAQALPGKDADLIFNEADAGVDRSKRGSSNVQRESTAASGPAASDRQAGRAGTGAGADAGRLEGQGREAESRVPGEEGRSEASPAGRLTSARAQQVGSEGRASGIPAGLPARLTDATRKLNARFNQWLRRSGRGTEQLRLQSVDQASLPDPVAQAIGAIAEATGLQVEIVRNRTPEVERFNGFTFDDGLIAIDEAADQPVTLVAMHEWVHNLRSTDPDLYDRLAGEVRAQGRLPAWARRMEREGNRTDPDSVVEELTADAVADAFTDPEFLRDLASRDVGLFRQAADAIMAFLDTLLGGARDRGTAEYLEDVQAFRDVLADVVQEFDARGRPQDGDAATAPDFQRVFHGTPYRGIEAEGFRMDRIGTGEGAQAYGWGIYFAGRREVAESYRKGLTLRDLIDRARDAYDEFDSPTDALQALLSVDGLSDPQRDLLNALADDDWLGFDYPHQAIRAAFKELDAYDASEATRAAVQRQGQLYEAEIPEDSDLLDWDAPLSEQSSKVLETVREVYASLGRRDPLLSATPKTGEAAYKDIGVFSIDRDGGDAVTATQGEVFRAASQALQSAGIPGLRYLDGGSRGSNWQLQSPDDTVSKKGWRVSQFGGANARWFDTEAQARAFMEANKPSRNYVIWDEALLTPERAEIRPMFQRPSNIQRRQLAQQSQQVAIGQIAAMGYPQGSRTFSYDAGRWDGVRGRLKEARINMQDKMLSMREIESDIEASLGVVLQDAERVYRLENLAHGRVSDQLEKLERDILGPMRETMRKAGLSLDQLHDYLLARHAPERNAKVASINPDMQDGGSGILTADAQAIMAGAKAGPYSGKPLSPEDRKALAEVAKMLDTMRARTLENLERSGQISGQQRRQLESAYKYYMPLRGKGDADDFGGSNSRAGAGGRMDYAGPRVRRALGRGEENLPHHIFAELLGDAERAIVGAELARVREGVLRLAMRYPNKDVWEVAPVDMEWAFSEATGEAYLRVKGRLEAQADSLLVPLNGKTYRLRIQDENLRDALLNLGSQDMNAVVRVLSAINRFQSATLTRYNPSFVAVNMLRDLGFGLTGVASEHGVKAAAEVAAGYAPAAAAIWRDLRSGKRGDASVPNALKTWSDWAREYTEAGAKTGMTLYSDIETLSKKYETGVRSLRDLWSNGLSGKAQSSVEAVKRAGGPILDVIDHANDSIENAIRLSLYVSLRKQGRSPDSAAEAAKNLTVNFNRKGKYAQALGAVWLFYNAAVQGSHRVLKVLSDKRVLGGLTALGALQGVLALSMMADDDDEDGVSRWDSIPPWRKSNSFIIPAPWHKDGYVAIPMPYGFNVFPFIGGRLAQFTRDLARKDERAVSSFANDVMAGAARSFSPIPFDDPKAIFGNVPGILLSLASNTDDLGRPISAETYGRKVPAATTGRATTPEVFKDLATVLNRLGGGSDDQLPVVFPALTDVSPDQLAFLWGEVTGGIGGNISAGMSTIEGIAGGRFESALEAAAAAPLVRSFGVVGDRNRAIADRYYRLSEDLELYHGRAKAATVELVQANGGDAAAAAADWPAVRASIGPLAQGLEPVRYKRSGKRSDGSRYAAGDYRLTAAGGLLLEPVEGSPLAILKDARKVVREQGAIIREARAGDLSLTEREAAIKQAQGTRREAQQEVLRAVQRARNPA